MASGFGSDTIVALAGRITAAAPVDVQFAWNSGRLNGKGKLGLAGDLMHLVGSVPGAAGGLAVDLHATRLQVLGWQRLAPTRIGLRLRAPTGGGQEGLRTLEFTAAADADRLVGWLPASGTRSSLVRRWYEDQLGSYRREALGTYAITAVVLACYVLQVVTGAGFAFNTETLYAQGANLPMQTLAGEPWRMLTAVFLHADLGHVIGNLLTFVALAPYVERLYGRPALVSIFLGAGLAGSAVDIFSNFSTVAIGASGAVFGIVGALLAYPLRRPGQLPLASMRVILALGGLYMAWSLRQGFAGVGVNNSAHVSGLLAGFVLGLLLAPAFERERRPALLPLAAVAALGMVMLGCALAFAAGRNSDDFRLARLVDQLEARSKDMDSACQSAEKRVRADPAAGSADFQSACVGSLDAIEAQLTGLHPGDEALRALVAEQLARIARRRDANRTVATLVDDIAAIQPADEARVDALRGCDAALATLDNGSARSAGELLRAQCITPLDRAIGMLDAGTAASPEALRYQHAARILWRSERDAFASMERALAQGDASAFDSAVDALNAARAAHAAATGRNIPAAPGKETPATKSR